jgi:rSAM/selenodomain-associated transferase 1
MPGAVKTRLAATVGDQAALAVYRWLAERTLRVLAESPRAWTVRALVAGDVNALGEWCVLVDEVRAQGEGDLGARMEEAMGAALREGYARVVIVGTDCPTLDAATVRAAMEALRAVPAVIGPALDGGYYLIGGSEALPVFDGVRWSTEVVAAETRARLTRAGLSWRELPAAADIDRAEDLCHLTARDDCPDWIRALTPEGR